MACGYSNAVSPYRDRECAMELEQFATDAWSRTKVAQLTEDPWVAHHLLDLESSLLVEHDVFHSECLRDYDVFFGSEASRRWQWSILHTPVAKHWLHSAHKP